MATLFPDKPNAVCIPAILVCPVPPLVIATVPEIVDARILVFNVVIDAVLAVILEVIDASAVVALVTSAVKLDVADVILVSKVAMVDEFTPPTVFTVGEVAVPLKSPANWIIPFDVVDASVGA